MLTEKQLKERKEYIGGSDAPAVCGLSPFKTPLEVYLEKRGEIEPADLSQNKAVHFGKLLEDIVAQEYARVTGRKVVEVKETSYHPKYPWMAANIDRDIIGVPGELEIKTGNAFNKEGWGEEKTDQVPNHYNVQCQHYMAVRGASWYDLAVLLGGNDFRTYRIPRDDELIEMIINKEGKFWERVKAGTPPPMDYGNSKVAGLLKRMYPGTNGKSINLPADIHDRHDHMNEAKEKIKKLKGEIKELDLVVDFNKNMILEAMGEAAIGLLLDGTGYTRKKVNKTGYSVEPSSYVDFRFSKKLKKG